MLAGQRILVAGFTGVEPAYRHDDDQARPGGAPSAVLRTRITGPATVGWRDGLRRTAEFRAPRIRAREYRR